MRKNKSKKQSLLVKSSVFIEATLHCDSKGFGGKQKERGDVTKDRDHCATC